MVVVREVVDGRNVAALAVVGDEVGADLERATLEGLLATALSLLNEPSAGEVGT
ncbi:hypothetical protein [Micromonospora arborensis]|uniref:hypothetical protein n=1 Tax=Micromonospora arborensis TaxID=2116518 RepID=UPI003721F6D7